ncbi:adenylate/guanylate cyclase domain-containing protein [Actinospongicola halichondriae]|uniref:adenylate/guanylate cyclase domain-containing protein n=1 Tax=Actinospongicola halichondriae TaxID=3236844 RepID=UPI003D3ED775
MDALWGLCWSRFGSRYSWAVLVVLALTVLVGVAVPMYVLVLLAEGDAVVAYGTSKAVVVALVAGTLASVLAPWAAILPGSSAWRDVERWAAGAEDVSATAALAGTYRFARQMFRRGLLTSAPVFGLVGLVPLTLVLGDTGRVAQWTVIAVVVGILIVVTGGHFWTEAAMRPARLALAEGNDVGDQFPKSSPTFGTWSTIVIMTQVVWMSMTAAFLAGVAGVAEHPIRALPIALGAAGLSASVTGFSVIRPGLAPLRDLAAATGRVEAGDFTQRLPVVQDNDLGVLSASFNRMQTGLAERERLQAAFGSYVDPALAKRLLAQGDDVFNGERLEVTVMFVDIRDFTPFAEANTAEDTVTHLNSVFEIVVDAVDTHGGHVNKFLGDGAMVVFGAPELHPDHAERALACAGLIDAQVTARFGGDTRIGIGINTGTVIAGTIGAARKREFTLIGDTVNVAARIEQLTKTTGDTTLVTQATLDALTTAPTGLTDRGTHHLKGKTAPVNVHALTPQPTPV